MSLLADLLSKVKYQGPKRDVPPNLRHAVSDYSEKYAAKKRLMSALVLVFVAVVSGAAAVYLINFYGKPYQAKKPLLQDEKSVEQVVKNMPPAPPPEVSLPVGTALEAGKEPASGSVVGKTKTKKGSAGRSVRRQQKPLQKEKPSLSQPEISELCKVAGEEEKPAGEKLSERDAYISAAQTYESRRDYHNALASYKKALNLDPGNHFILNNIASVLLTMGSYNEAIPYLNKVLSIEKDYLPALINLGIAHAMLGNFQESETYLAKALAIEPSNASALLNSAILYERQAKNDKAYAFFYKLSQSGNIQGYLGIARIAEKQGKTREAANIYREIISMNCDPENKKFADERLLQLGR